ncbi:DUF2017 domain-containing protein [Bailinhaonella thermotolerans]|uniref:DUF2017 domain-containing protein n=1 Tax=Bailinhaonella thermotolerans TaxID=1070861 RepID=A0A3A4AT50_9ACTN|nr:DUF2017 domain-containing protein [Bailinhaonella thermotolerans]RJL24548.1 DUF2017 domain-containing protein [Bailinhaonella thermotolerans]
MNGNFAPAPGGGVALRLDAGEVAILRSLVSQLMGLVEPPETHDDPLARAVGISASAATPADPVLARLFPDAYPEDPEAAGEFRRYTEGQLREGKRADAAVVLETANPGEAVLDAEQARAWLRSLNDVRLALGVRLEVTEDTHEEIARMSEDDPRYPVFVTYDWLTFLQDSLVRALW